MKSLLAIAFFAASIPLAGQESPSPEECRAAESAITLVYAGKTYRLASETCRQQFLSDPERFSQLYDALAELEAAGKNVAPAPASLVPS